MRSKNKHNPFYLRCFSASVGLILLSGSYVLLGITGIKFFLALICLMASYEYLNVTFFIKQKPNFITRFCFILACHLYLYKDIFSQNTIYILIACLFIVFISCELTKVTQKFHQTIYNILVVAVGIIYLGYIPSLIIDLLHLNVYLFFTLCGIIFIGDTLSYVAGRIWGETKILPHISPHKTQIGCLGGLVGSAFAGSIAYFMWFPHLAFPIFVLISLITGFVGQIGDFFESLLKREAGVKDSGWFMPGHGGTLDRIDSFLFAIPVYVWLVHIFII